MTTLLLQNLMKPLDGEFLCLISPEYDTGFAGSTVKELSSRLQKNGFAFNHCDFLKGKVLKHLYYLKRQIPGSMKAVNYLKTL